MCDTWVALQDATLSGQVMLGKNSDRPIFDCQPLICLPRQSWSPGSRIKLEYVEIPRWQQPMRCLAPAPIGAGALRRGLTNIAS